MKPLERFEAWIDRTGDCWLWTGSLTPAGYGYFRIAPGRRPTAHRAAWELYVGPIPDGMEIDHLCFTRNCVRPDHLEPVTRQENHRRRRGRPRNHRVTSHCLHGHLREGNTTFNTYGARICVPCRREADRRCKARAAMLKER